MSDFRLSFKKAATVFAVVFFTACGEGSSLLVPGGVCTGYGDPSTSNYILPFPSGTAKLVTQANCGAFTHKGTSRYAYDFAMDIGSSIRAARGGTVYSLQESYTDGNGGIDANYIVIQHSDGSYAVYAHLTRNGVLVNQNATVNQGDIIGLSGNTGYSTAPHLHFEVQSTINGSSVPVTFHDALTAPYGLRSNTTYTAGT